MEHEETLYEGLWHEPVVAGAEGVPEFVCETEAEVSAQSIPRLAIAG